MVIANSLKRYRAGHSTPFWMLTGFLFLTFLVGGGSRSDITSLAILRPVSALILGYGILGITIEQVRRYRFVFMLAVAIVILVAIQLIPLPPSIWTVLPGRTLVARIDQAAGLGPIWRPISLVPSATWNALFALLPPLAATVLAVRVRHDELPSLLLPFILVGIVSSVLAVLQISGPEGGPLYFYRLTNPDSAVGLFANRNHQAVFLASLLPILAAYASPDRRSSTSVGIRGALALAIGSFLLALIVVTGSRGGMLMTIIALPIVPLMYRLAPNTTSLIAGRRSLWLWSVCAALLMALILAPILLGRAQAVDRLIAGISDQDARYRAWKPMLDAGLRYFPVGSGFGSFADIFKVDEPYELLTPLFFAHAHNDWLEIVITGGLPALTIMVLGLGVGLAAGKKAWQSPRMEGDHVLMARTGFVVMLLFALASFVDYPLRVPSLACFFSVAAIWAGALFPQRVQV